MGPFHQRRCAAAPVCWLGLLMVPFALLIPRRPWALAYDTVNDTIHGRWGSGCYWVAGMAQSC